MGEYAFEYLKRIFHNFRLFFILEGSEDEVVIVTEVQWFIISGILIKANTGFGITSRATDLASEIGIMFSLFP